MIGKALFASKTFWVAFAGLLVEVLALPQLGALVPADWATPLALISSILVILIRTLENRPQPITGLFHR